MWEIFIVNDVLLNNLYRPSIHSSIHTTGHTNEAVKSDISLLYWQRVCRSVGRSDSISVIVTTIKFLFYPIANSTNSYEMKPSWSQCELEKGIEKYNTNFVIDTCFFFFWWIGHKMACMIMSLVLLLLMCCCY